MTSTCKSADNAYRTCAAYGRGSGRLLLNVLIIAALMMTAFMLSAVTPHALSGLESSGTIKSSGGAVLRANASTLSANLGVLKKGSTVEIQKEVFTTKKGTAATKKWYYVSTGAGEGYVRSDLVKVNIYGRANGKATKKVVYRNGAGTKMAKKGTFKKNKTFTVVMEAKAKGSNAVWYKIKKGSKYYYLKGSSVSLSTITSGVPQTVTGNPATEVTQSAEALAVVNGACSWAVDIANNNTFHYGYGSAAHHNGCYFCGTQTLVGGRSKLGILDYEYTYCCNPFVHAAFAHGGNEQTMLEVCKRGSSYWVSGSTSYPKSPLFANLGVPDKSLLKKGDVLCWTNHVMLYLGDGKIAEAAGGDDNVQYSTKWNNSIHVTTLTDAKYKKVIGAYRYIGNTN